MINVLKLAAVYTGMYFVFCTLYWICFVTVSLFWKPIAIFFTVVLTLLGVEYFVKGRAAQATAEADARQRGEDMADYIAMRYGASE